ncbi:MAG: hypothetical protein CMJ78_02245, partial [Planctomycetaceae bacterium]|nr:hypothetical protein [Planctomycetaceae bacterium]
TWDCVVVHPSVTFESKSPKNRDALVRQLVRAQDLHLIDRATNDKSSAAELLQQWIQQQIDKHP